MGLKRKIVRLFLKIVFRLYCRGEERLQGGRGGLLVICNYQATLDLFILSSLLPAKSLFVISKDAYPSPLLQWLLSWLDFVNVEEVAGIGWRGLTEHLAGGGVAAIFPETAPSENGSFAKMLVQPLQSAIKADAMVAAVYMSGSQYHASSRRESAFPRHRFPKIGVTVLEPEKPGAPFPDLLGQALVAHFQGRGNLWGALCRTARVHGRSLQVVTDSTGAELSYKDIFVRALALGRALARLSESGERVAIMLPTSAAGLVTFFALHAFGRIPALLNFTSGSQSLVSACNTGDVKNLRQKGRS